MILAIDWDEVIHDRKHPAEGKRLGPPMAGAKEALYELKSRGHEIIIHSVVDGKVIADWMSYFELPYDKIVLKPIADLYIDDRAYHFISWEKTMSAIMRADGPRTRSK